MSELSIEQLTDIQVTSVSKRPEAVSQAPAAIYVITHDEIQRSGVATVPEILRLAPNLQVYQAGASRYVITARGMNGAPAAQNFANKLLVLIDGRTVYSPLFSGVYWDMQDVLPQDIERVEVISGPGATLWGANAVNGVVNIITRNAADSQGGLATAQVGDRRRALGLRYGGSASDALTWRAYAKTSFEDDTHALTGGDANDHWSRNQLGGRLDWAASPRDAIVLQGDIYNGAEARAATAAETISGGNLTGRWRRTWDDGSVLQLQAYADHVRRRDNADSSGFHVDTYDLDVQHSLPLGERHSLVWGGGYRSTDYRIDPTVGLSFQPPSRRLALANVYVQDSVALSARSRLIVGLKIEDDPYVDAVALPNLRLSWTPTEGATLWAAASRAIRSATPFDRDVVEVVGGGPFLVGSAEFESEKLTAYEAGAKIDASPRASFSLNVFYNDYDDLRSIEVDPATFVPLHWGDRLGGHTYGAELWGDLQARPWWRLSASLFYLEQKYRFDADASGLLGVSQVGNDPRYSAQLKSSLTLGDKVNLDTMLRYVAALPAPRTPGYVELNGRLAWNLAEHTQLALSARNLLHDDHLEYTDGTRIPRSVAVDLLWRF